MTEPAKESCRYAGKSGRPCPQPTQPGRDLCFWHDPAESKSGPDIKLRLEKLAGEGQSLEGFLLSGADLGGVNLTLGHSEHQVDLRGADLSRANLSGAHLFNIDLRGSNLLKADCTQANLNRANLGDANLLGAVMENTRLEQVDWGRHFHQEIQAVEAEKKGEDELAMDLLQEAEETYRYLRTLFERTGNITQAGNFYLKEKVMRRMQMRRWSGDWLWSKIIDVLCGYGEVPYRVITFSLLVIFFSGILFFLFGVNGPEGHLVLNAQAGFGENLLTFLACLYYSVVTFTTLGYGEITPSGFVRAIAATEAFIGSFSMALFVVVFVRKMEK